MTDSRDSGPAYYAAGLPHTSASPLKRTGTAILRAIAEHGLDEETLARAALVSLYHPSNKMLKAAARAMSPGCRPVPERVSAREKHLIRYQSMIQAALLEGYK